MQFLGKDETLLVTPRILEGMDWKRSTLPVYDDTDPRHGNAPV